MESKSVINKKLIKVNSNITEIKNNTEINFKFIKFKDEISLIMSMSKYISLLHQKECTDKMNEGRLFYGLYPHGNILVLMYSNIYNIYDMRAINKFRMGIKSDISISYYLRKNSELENSFNELKNLRLYSQINRFECKSTKSDSIYKYFDLGKAPVRDPSIFGDNEYLTKKVRINTFNRSLEKDIVEDNILSIMENYLHYNFKSISNLLL